MKMSKTERLLLLNQLSILEILNPEEQDTYAHQKKIVENGYEHDYESLFSALSDEVPEEVSNEVWDILQMHRSLNFSFRDLEDKGDLTESDIKFKGFDGNNEITQMVYAKFVLHDLERYSELKDTSKYPDYNTHSPRLGKYRRMLAVWEECTGRYDSNLTADQIKKILNA